MKTVSVVTPCRNEEGNVRLLAERVRRVFDGLEDCAFEHIFADNGSGDGTLQALRELAAEDSRVKVIANTRNFGPSRSLFNALLAAEGDAVVLLAADLQDPPELIPEFIRKWREGFQVVFGLRVRRSESPVMTAVRRAYYRVLQFASEDELVADAGDFVLFDRSVQEVLRRIHDTDPYIRGLLASLGFSHTGVPYHMQPRHSGTRPRNPLGLLAYGLNGFVHHATIASKAATFCGLLLSLLCFLAAFVYLVLKALFWDMPPQGFPTLFVGMFFLAGVQLFFLGYIGEMTAAIFRQTKNLPIVIERERINFGPRGKGGES